MVSGLGLRKIQCRKHVKRTVAHFHNGTEVSAERMGKLMECYIWGKWMGTSCMQCKQTSETSWLREKVKRICNTVNHHGFPRVALCGKDHLTNAGLILNQEDP